MTTVLDNGLSLRELAASMQRVYASACRPQEVSQDDLAALVLEGETGAGWVGAATVLAGEYGASEQGEVELPVAALTDKVRAAFYEASELAMLPATPRERLAWEATTRHGAGAVVCDDGEVPRLMSGEAIWRPWVEQTAATRGISLG